MGQHLDFLRSKRLQQCRFGAKSSVFYGQIAFTGAASGQNPGFFTVKPVLVVIIRVIIIIIIITMLLLRLLPTCLPTYLLTCLPAYLPTCLPAYLASPCVLARLVK